MFARAPGAGSLYWLRTRDHSGRYLEGNTSYFLDVPQPVPAKLFCSITVYDAPTDAPLRLYFGPEPPATGDDPHASDRWIQTTPGVGWFVYFRSYGPEGPAFNGQWQLPDFQPT
jgi:hypothetical protein